MRIALAEVRENFDPDREGKIYAKIDGVGDSDKLIHMTNLYNSGSDGTVKTPAPLKGTSILVCQPENSDEWFYLATTGAELLSNANTATEKLHDFESPNAIASDRGNEGKGGSGRDNDLLIQNELGCGIELAQTLGAKNSVVHSKVFSGQGKKVLVSDSPEIDSVIIDSNAGAKISVTGNPKSRALPSQAVEINTVGPQTFLNLNSATNVVVQDGRDLQLINNSTGSNKGVANPEAYGNVNLQSKNRDVNLFTKSGVGRIFIECLNPNGSSELVQLKTHGNGTIRLIATKVEITAEKLGVEANSIDLRSSGNINLGAGGSINMQAGGTVNADGSLINLNSGASSPPSPNNGESDSHYGDQGVTTF
jgi:hypothetical protein